MSQKWKETLGILTPAHEEVEINGKKQKCSPMTGKLLGTLRPIIGQVAEAIGMFISAVSKDDLGKVERQISEAVKNEKGEALLDSEDNPVLDISLESIQDPMSPEMVDKRMETRKSAIKQLTEAILCDSTLEVGAMLIMDCYRGIFLRTDNGAPVDWPTPSELLDDTDICTLVEMLKGVMEANKKVFGPFLDDLKPTFQSLKSQMMKVGEEDENQSSAQTKSGKPSKNPTSGSPAGEDTEASTSS